MLTAEEKPERHIDLYRIESFLVEPLSAVTMTFKMPKGAILEGYLTVNGGNDDVRFYIKDSFGNTMLDIKRAYERYDFCYISKSEGIHTLYFNNGFSYITSKHINLHYRVK